MKAETAKTNRKFFWFVLVYFSIVFGFVAFLVELAQSVGGVK